MRSIGVLLFYFAFSILDGNYALQEIKVAEQIHTVPKDSVEVYIGQDVNIFLSENIVDLEECKIIPPSSFESDHNFTSTEANCQFVIRNIQSEMNGTWTIEGISEKKRSAKIEVIVKSFPSLKNDIYISRGAPARLIMGPEESLFCRAINPTGNILNQHFGKCVIDIDRVTNEHAGPWFVDVGLIGSIDTVRFKYDVHVEDLGEQNPGRMITHINLSENMTYLQMECKLLVSSMKSCSMIRSDGQVFMLSEGIGSGRYTYFVNEEEKHTNGIDFVKCGMHIDPLTSIDMEPWRCIIVHGENNTQSGSSLTPKLYNGNITVSENRTLAISTESPISAALNKPFDLICNYPISIQYCWFRSPDGTLYTPMQNANEVDFEYVGDGLAMGHCGIRIKSAKNSDRGTWKCNVGTGSTQDEEARIVVQIFDTLLVAEVKERFWQKNISMACQTFDNSSIEYCRFLRPDGRGINPAGNKSAGYTNNGTDLETGRCQLNLLHYSNLDIGRWMCIAKPHFQDIEYFDSFLIFNHHWGYYSNSTYFLTWLIYFIVISALVLILSLVIFKFRVRSARRARCQRNCTQTTASPATPETTERRRSSPPSYTEVTFLENETKTAPA